MSGNTLASAVISRFMRCLVTAGNTREPIDSVRQWSNIFTGNTGLRIAQALAEQSAVDLLTSNAEHLRQLPSADRRVPNANGIAAIGFNTHAELRQTLQKLLATHAYDAVFMTAAVADYAPAGAFAVTERIALEDGTERWTVTPVQQPKIKSSHESLAFFAQRSEKLIDLFRTAWQYRGLLVKFKLEVGISVDELIAVGRASRLASGADYLVANTLDMVDGEKAGAYLISDTAAEWVPRAALPARLARLLGDSPMAVA